MQFLDKGKMYDKTALWSTVVQNTANPVLQI